MSATRLQFQRQLQLHFPRLHLHFAFAVTFAVALCTGAFAVAHFSSRAPGGIADSPFPRSRPPGARDPRGRVTGRDWSTTVGYLDRGRWRSTTLTWGRLWSTTSTVPVWGRLWSTTPARTSEPALSPLNAGRMPAES